MGTLEKYLNMIFYTEFVLIPPNFIPNISHLYVYK